MDSCLGLSNQSTLTRKSVGKIENNFNLHDLVSLPLITGTVLYHEDRPDRPCKRMHLDYDKIIMIVMELKVKSKKILKIVIAKEGGGCNYQM